MPHRVLPARHEIMWRDGTAIGVHPVEVAGVPCRFLRAVPGPDLQPVVIDLRRLVPGIDQDLATAPERDRPGVVFYSLRHRYRSARDFMDAALATGRVDLQAQALKAVA